MGITSHIARFILKEHAYRNITGDLLLLGRQQIFMTPDEALRLLGDENIEIRGTDGGTLAKANGLGENYISDTDFFGLFSDANMRALDVSDYEGADVILDINASIPEEYENKFDFILDGGVLDNVFDPASTIKNVAKLLRPGGRVIHTNFMSYFPSVYLGCSLDWYFDYYAINNFIDCKTYLGLHDRDADLTATPWDMFVCLPISKVGDVYNFRRADFDTDRNMLALVIAEKGVESTSDKVPIQYHYRSEEENRIFAGHAIRFMNSARPAFSVPTGLGNENAPACPDNFLFVGSWSGRGP